MARSLLDGKISREAVQVVDAAVAERWSRSRDLVDALERCAVTAEAAKAEQAGQLDALEDDLFRFARILEREPRAPRRARRTGRRPIEARRAAARRPGRGQGRRRSPRPARPAAGRPAALARRWLVHYQRSPQPDGPRLVATVWVASPLSDDQRDRVSPSSLASQYSHEVHLNVIVDPDVLGGVRVAHRRRRHRLDHRDQVGRRRSGGWSVDAPRQVRPQQPAHMTIAAHHSRREARTA